MRTLFQIIGLLCILFLVVMAYGSLTMPAQPATINASKYLVRIDQNDRNQYASTQEYKKWSASACSSASLAELFNAYGGRHTISDVLKVEARIGAISAEQGLLRPEGIDQTASKFGFKTATLQDASLDKILAIANDGTPVLVNFPPATWTGGHFLVVLGSSVIKDVSYVHLADSSKLNMQYMTSDRFQHYWRGFAKVVTPENNNPLVLNANNNTSSVVGSPTISAAFINTVLATFHSPASGKGQALYDLGVKYGIDPAFALAFFQHESGFGMQGEARKTLSLGNLRCINDRPCVDQDRGGYAQFYSWEDGFECWYQLIRNVYVDRWQLSTVESILQKYAPSADNNDPASYANSVKSSVAIWRAGKVAA